ncbi:MAG: chorismate--pyruvate lyase [Lachnospiraceae bacterium]|nr:chorismate--pyruvate lyase [Lachnospiraceae bacterium]
MFERKEYIVERLDGDYAYLKEESADDLKCVARALLPPAIREGSRLSYEMMEYELIVE